MSLVDAYPFVSFMIVFLIAVFSFHTRKGKVLTLVSALVLVLVGFWLFTHPGYDWISVHNGTVSVAFREEVGEFFIEFEDGSSLNISGKPDIVNASILVKDLVNHSVSVWYRPIDDSHRVVVH